MPISKCNLWSTNARTRMSRGYSVSSFEYAATKYDRITRLFSKMVKNVSLKTKSTRRTGFYLSDRTSPWSSSVGTVCWGFNCENIHLKFSFTFSCSYIFNCDSLQYIRVSDCRLPLCWRDVNRNRCSAFVPTIRQHGMVDLPGNNAKRASSSLH